MNNCALCQHSANAPVDPQNIGAKTQLECRCNPPQVFAMPVNTMRGPVFMPAAAFPVVSGDWYCSNFVGKPVANS